MTFAMKRTKRKADDLPLDCWCHTLTFYEDHSSMMSLVLSIKGLYEYICNVNPSGGRNIEFKAKYLPKLKKNYVYRLSIEKKVEEYNFDLFTKLSSLFPNLQHIKFDQQIRPVDFSWDHDEMYEEPIDIRNQEIHFVRDEKVSEKSIITNLVSIFTAQNNNNNIVLQQQQQQKFMNLVYLETTVRFKEISLQNLPRLRYATIVQPLDFNDTDFFQSGFTVHPTVNTVKKSVGTLKLLTQNLPCLEHLQIVGYNVDTPNTQLPSIREIILENVRKVENCSSFFKTNEEGLSFPNLEVLRVRQFNDIESLPLLPNLETLIYSNKSYFKHTNETSFTYVRLEEISDHPNLRNIIVQGRNAFTAAGPMLPSAPTTQLGGGKRMSNLPKLEFLSVEGLSIQELENLPSLEEVVGFHSRIMKVSDSCAYNIKSIKLRNSCLPKLTEFEKFVHLKCLTLHSYCINRYEKPIFIDLSRMVNLEVLDVDISSKFFGIVLLGRKNHLNDIENNKKKNTKLKVLKYVSPKVYPFDSFGDLVLENLETLRLLCGLSGTNTYTDTIRSLTQYAPNLRNLDIELTKVQLNRKETFEIEHALQNLQSLRICCCPMNQNLVKLGKLENLETLTLEFVLKLSFQQEENFSSCFPNLKSLNIFNQMYCYTTIEGGGSKLEEEEERTSSVKSVSWKHAHSGRTFVDYLSKDLGIKLNTIEEFLFFTEGVDSLNFGNQLSKFTNLTTLLLISKLSIPDSGTTTIEGLPNLRVLGLGIDSNRKPKDDVIAHFTLKSLPLLTDILVFHEHMKRLHPLKVTSKDEKMKLEKLQFVEAGGEDLQYFDISKMKKYFENDQVEAVEDWIVFQDQEEEEEIIANWNFLEIDLYELRCLERIHYESCQGVVIVDVEGNVIKI